MVRAVPPRRIRWYATFECLRGKRLQGKPRGKMNLSLWAVTRPVTFSCHRRSAAARIVRRPCFSERTIPWPSTRPFGPLGGLILPRLLKFEKNPCKKNVLWAVQSHTRSPMAGDMQITCSDCGQEFTFSSADQQFFQERGYSTPKRCKPCRQAKKADQGGSGHRSAPSQGTPVICSGCGQPTTVPFEPRGDRPVYCRDCYTARKGTGGGGRGR
jgi:CxxC-x17-CxxC domain-containing protein